MGEIVSEFFSRKYENKINKDILYYSFSHDEVERYVNSVIDEPISRYLTYIKTLKTRDIIKPEDVFQFSKVEDATINFCEKVKALDNPGLTYLEVGKLLQNDGKDRKDGAYIKYGENHVKLAKELGLAFELCNTYYLSGIGYIYSELPEEKRQDFLTRLILRSTLIKRLYQASQNGNVELRQFLYMLADSTYIRRRSNVKKILGYLEKLKETDVIKFIECIKF